MIIENGYCPFKLLILDIDGVMTDGRKYYANDGKAVYKSFNDRDFTAIKRFKMKGVNVCFLSGDSTVNENMAKNRGIDFFKSETWDSGSNKGSFIPKFVDKYKVKPEDMAYFGDDYYDLGIMELVGYPLCTNEAPWIVQRFCNSVDASFNVRHLWSSSDPIKKGYVSVLYDSLYWSKWFNER